MTSNKLADQHAHHERLTHEADDLLDHWIVANQLPRITSLAEAEWRSADGKDSHRVMAWAGDAFDPSWSPTLHRFIRRACVEDTGMWRDQFPKFSQFYGNIFVPGPKVSSLNMVTVTPSRVPSSTWPKLRGTTLEEQLSPSPVIHSYAEPLDLGLINPVTLPLRGLHWAGRSDASNKTLRIGQVDAIRTFLGRHPSSYTRIFEVDPRSNQRKSKEPPTQDAVVVSGKDVRVHAPMIQFWKIYPTGMVDLINIETNRGSGRVMGIRCTTQSFADVVRQDPYFAMVFRELERMR